ncbi:MAG: (2Fe-2S)-binding protein [Bdellovibrionales bacterium]|nr:(2Fe-2S)-binding protein [Bdellovibrionales bacterium]
MPTVLVEQVSPNESMPSNQTSFQVENNKVLYDELERQGLTLPHGCLAGSCGSCRIHVVKGIENLAPMGAVEQDTVNHIKDSHPGLNVRLSCRAKILGDVTIKPIK